jgi:NRPS condensation-like uncharacterized protein
VEQGRGAPGRLRAEFGDKIMSAMRGIVNPLIQARVAFDRPLDAERLRRAFHLLLDAEPVLGRRFVQRYFRPYWAPSDAASRAAAFEVQRPQEVEAAAQEFFAQPVDIQRGPCLRLRLLQGEGDTLCATIDHLASDAGGFKEALYRLAEVYRALGDDAAFVPPLNRGSRSHTQVLKLFPRAQRRAIGARGTADLLRYNAPGGHHRLEYSGTQPHVATVHVKGERFRAVRDFGRDLEATLNDVVVAAWYTALHRAIQPPGGEAIKLLSTADLRRYLPGQRAAAVTNLSGFVYLTPDAPPGASLAETTAAVRDLMNRHKGGHPGLGDFAAATALARLLPSGAFRSLALLMFREHYQAGRMFTGLTNMGPIQPEALDFGDARVEQAWLIPPQVYPPMVTLGISGFGESLSFSISYFRGAEGPDAVAALLDSFLGLLPG